jgi:hypothetical protein
MINRNETVRKPEAEPEAKPTLNSLDELFKLYPELGNYHSCDKEIALLDIYWENKVKAQASYLMIEYLAQSCIKGTPDDIQRLHKAVEEIKYYQPILSHDEAKSKFEIYTYLGRMDALAYVKKIITTTK